MATRSLIELRSDLRNLKYTQFDTQAPYITKPIPAYEQDGRRTNQLNARVDDLSRFSKILTSQPGLKFVGNQTLLKLEETRREFRKAKESGKTLVGSALKAAGSSLLGTFKTTASILAQVPVNGTGTHFIQGFGGRQYLQLGDKPKTGLGKFLRNTLEIGGGINGNQRSLNGETIILDFDAKGDIKTNGQESILKDIPSTLDSRQDFNTGTDNTSEPAPSLFGQNKFDEIKNSVKPELRGQRDVDFNNGLSKLVNTDGKLVRTRTVANPNVDKNAASEVKLDQTALNAQQESSIPSKLIKSAPDNMFQPEYKVKNKEGNLVNYAKNSDSIILKFNPGKRGKNLTDIKVSQESDIVNISDARESDYFKKNKVKDPGAYDIIPFKFNIFTPQDPKGRSLYFRAFLKDLNDNFSGEWQGNKFIGRAEEFYTYQGFKRDISFSFNIAAFSRDELAPLYSKLNELASSTSPVYRGNGAFMQGVMVSITIGDYINNLNGVVNSVGLSWNLSYPWEINYEEADDIAKVPHLLDVNIGFTPIHNFNASYRSEYIAPGNWKKSVPID